MAAVFDGDNLIITLEAPTAGVLAQEVEQLYDDAKVWFLAGENTRYPFPFRTSGGDDLTPGVKAGAYYFLQTQLGWRIISTDEDQTINYNGNLIGEDSDLPIIVVTPGRTVLHLGLQPITQNVDEILVDSQDALFSDARVWLDIDEGAAGTVFPQGTPGSPVNNLSDAQAIIVARNLPQRVHLHGTITLTGADNIDDYNFKSETADTARINFGGASTIGASFESIKLSGSAIGAITASDYCICINLSNHAGRILRSGLVGTITMATGSTNHVFTDCHTHLIGADRPIFDYNSLPNCHVQLISYVGEVEIQNLDQASSDLTISILAGELVLDSTCTAGAVVVAGDPEINDNSGGTLTIDKTNTMFARPQEGSETFEEQQRIQRAAAAGRIIQLPDGSYRIRDRADTKDRITGDDDVNSGRTISATDGT